MHNRILTLTWLKFSLIIGLLSGLLAGCGGVPNKESILADARQSYQSAQNNLDVRDKAGNALYDAEKALQKAEAAEDAAEMQHLAYLAEQQAEIAIEVANRKVAEAERETLAEQSKDIVIMSRTQEVDRKARQLEIEKAQVQALQRELEELKAKRTDRGLVLTLGDVLFETGKATLLTGALNEVNNVASFLGKHPARNVLVEGHTDNVGSEDYNMGLSQRRADAVKFALISRGVASNQILSKGWGESRPVATNSTASGRQQNRRVEITILNEGNPLPNF